MIADFVWERFGPSVHFIADVAGGQGMLARLLNKRYNYECEVIDTRTHTLRGVTARNEEFAPSMAAYYDLIISIHADEATRPVAEAALVRPTILVPCCNFWSPEKLGQEELLQAIEKFYQEQGIFWERIRFNFNGPKNVGLVTKPPQENGPRRSSDSPGDKS
ncbi:MAG TPA: hypothetical protein VGJ51_18455 [Candidatus Angelobacter sp.]